MTWRSLKFLLFSSFSKPSWLKEVWGRFAGIWSQNSWICYGLTFHKETSQFISWTLSFPFSWEGNWGKSRDFWQKAGKILSLCRPKIQHHPFHGRIPWNSGIPSQFSQNSWHGRGREDLSSEVERPGIILGWFLMFFRALQPQPDSSPVTAAPKVNKLWNYQQWSSKGFVFPEIFLLLSRLKSVIYVNLIKLLEKTNSSVYKYPENPSQLSQGLIYPIFNPCIPDFIVLSQIPGAPKVQQKQLKEINGRLVGLSRKIFPKNQAAGKSKRKTWILEKAESSRLFL